jgi:hypothetical protein
MLFSGSTILLNDSWTPVRDDSDEVTVRLFLKEKEKEKVIGAIKFSYCFLGGAIFLFWRGDAFGTTSAKGVVRD